MSPSSHPPVCASRHTVCASRHTVCTLIALALCLAWFEFSSTDMLIAEWFYDRSAQAWIWPRIEPISHLFLYDGIKVVLALLGLALGGSLLLIRRSQLVQRYARGIRIVLLSLIFVTGCVAGLKAQTNVTCPRHLVEFGGQIDYVGVFSHYPGRRAPLKRQRCFPAGHASGGFALMSLFFFFKSSRNRRRALHGALILGWLMGAYKMAIGDHFLSHTTTTMLLAWLIINVVVIVERQLFRDDRTPEATAGNQDRTTQGRQARSRPTR